MINRKTAMVIGELYQMNFSYTETERNNYKRTYIKSGEFYDFFFERDYPVWLCNRARNLNTHLEMLGKSIVKKRLIKVWVMGFATGEEFNNTNWTQESRLKNGQFYLKKFSLDILNYYKTIKPHRGNDIDELIRNLELCGYSYLQNKLVETEQDILEPEKEVRLLTLLYKKLNLKDEQTTLHHLDLSEQHYLDGKWDDCISNCRKFMENTIREIANEHCLKTTDNSLEQNKYTRPVEVRKYLKTVALVEEKEVELLARLYGLLSETGSHPYIAHKDQAQLFRNLALIVTRFIMLKYEGYLAQNP